MKIISQIDDETFVVKLEEKDKTRNQGTRIIMAHDYVGIKHDTYLSTINGLSIRHSPNFSSNMLRVNSYIQIGTKEMHKIILPYLNKQEYLQPEHFKDRVHTEDDTYQEPKRWVKGDKYPAYSYTDCVVHYWENGVSMTSFSLEGEKEFSHVTTKVFEELILPSLNK